MFQKKQKQQQLELIQENDEQIISIGGIQCRCIKIHKHCWKVTSNVFWLKMEIDRQIQNHLLAASTDANRYGIVFHFHCKCHLLSRSPCHLLSPPLLYISSRSFYVLAVCLFFSISIPKNRIIKCISYVMFLYIYVFQKKQKLFVDQPIQFNCFRF